MVREICKKEGLLNSVVFGCCSDGFYYTFLRIDNHERWSTCDLQWEKTRDRREDQGPSRRPSLDTPVSDPPGRIRIDTQMFG
ncbi:hypothetical protein DTO280E4_8836 [Paecilomyces variotii]|nr:hypothetical protein DTO280E4_8836 [Paecilomyces variotii]